MISRSRHALVAALSIASLGACTSLDIASQASPALASELAALEAPASWVFGAGVDQTVAASWSEVLSDDTLAALIEEALANNPSLRASAESVARSEALLAQARAGLVPFIGVSAGANGGGLVDNGQFSDSYSASITSSWEADLWGGIRAGVLGAGYDVEATKAAFRSSREALIASVARTYIVIIEAQKQADLSEATLAAQVETLRIVNIRYGLGAASRRETVLAESDVASARDNLVTAKAARISAALALQSLLGRYPDGDLVVAADFPSVASAAGTGNPAALIRRRPDILAAEYDVLGAFATTRAVQTSRWPDISLSANLNSAASDPGRLLDPVSLAYSVGTRLVGTLFDGGLTKARIEAASASERQAIAAYGRSVLDGFLDVEANLQNIETLDERLIYVRQGAAAARETLRLAEIQYKQGAIDLLDVLTFRQRSFQTDRTLISIERQLIDAQITLYLALGGADTASER